MIEIAEIFRQAGDLYRRRFGAHMLASHRRVMRDVETCRTPHLGGQLWRCDRCEAERYSYHSCQNRHCPKCHGEQTRRWLESWRQRLLPCSYFLLTFTLPEQLRTLARANQKTLYSILLRSAAESLALLAADPKYVGARLGMIAILHTWTRDMRYHPHVHILATAGGWDSLSSVWRKPRNGGFLVPGRALSVIFRGKVRDALHETGLWTEAPADPWRRKWVVHCQHAGDGRKVLGYIGRYIHRIAITNNRIERFEDGAVTLRYRERATGRIQRTTLDAQLFIARFLQHVLPKGFKKIRFYGLFSSRQRKLLKSVRRLHEEHPALVGASAPGMRTANTEPAASNGPPIHRCPYCLTGTLIVVASFPRPRRNGPIPRGPPR